MHGLHSKCSILWLSLVNFSFLSHSILKVHHGRHLSLPLLTSSSSPNPVPFPAGSPPSHLSLGLIWNILLYSLYPARCPYCFTCHGISSTFSKFLPFPCWVLREQGCLSCSLQQRVYSHLSSHSSKCASLQTAEVRKAATLPTPNPSLESSSEKAAIEQRQLKQ